MSIFAITGLIVCYFVTGIVLIGLSARLGFLNFCNDDEIKACVVIWPLVIIVFLFTGMLSFTVGRKL